MAAPRLFCWSCWSSFALSVVLLAACLALLAPLPAAQQPASSATTNDAPCERACDRPSLPPDVTARYVEHYRAVEEELRAAPAGDLDATRRAARERAIGLLDEYLQRADFGVNVDWPDARVPHFRDAWGRHCAVAYLMHRTGEDVLVDRIVAERNTAWLFELAELDEVRAWADSQGLTLAELTRMHGPGFFVPVTPPTPGTGGGQATGVPAAGTSSTPASNAAAGSTTSRPAARPSDAGQASPGECSVTPGRTVPKGQRTPFDRVLSDTSLASVTGADHTDDWWTWWELNKSEFLELNRLAVETPPYAGTRYRFGSSIPTGRREQVAAEARPHLQAALSDPDAGVRARAAVAWARVGGGESIPDLMPLLEDKSLDVRHAAILALGASGSPAAVPVLLRLAGQGHLGGGDDVLSPWARPLALTALGLGRRHGLPESVDDFVADMLVDEQDGGNDDVRAAGLVYDRLARSQGLDDRALLVFRDEDRDSRERCRATELLGLTADSALLPQVTSALAGPDLEVRRSAALALGGFHHALIAPRLQTAFELESDALTRGFILIALGRQGGTGAVEFLRRTLDRGPSAARPWAALALGIAARDHGDDEARRALVRALEDDPNSAEAAAFALACGIARDHHAVPWVRGQLVDGASPRLRLAAALSLAMIDARDECPLLRQRLEQETSPLARVGLAQALGHFGAEEDAPLLLSVVRELHNPELQAHVAAALGFHGTAEALQGVLELAIDTQGSAASRAAAWDALGLLLDPRPALVLADVSAGANFAVFPAWITAVLASQTL